MYHKIALRAMNLRNLVTMKILAIGGTLFMCDLKHGEFGGLPCHKITLINCPCNLELENIHPDLMFLIVKHHSVNYSYKA